MTRYTFDVAIIGGGLTGALCAYALATHGKKVALLEKGRIGQGATGLTTAFLTQNIDTDASDLIKIHGRAKAKAILDSHGVGINYIARIVQKEKIDCEFTRCANYIYTNDPKEDKRLEQEYHALRDLKLNVTLKSDNQLGFKNSSYIEVENQAKFHPLKFVDAILDIAQQNGALVYEDTEVTEISDKHTVRAGDFTVTADWIIAATYSPFKQPLRLFFKKGMYVTYVLELHLPAGSLTEGIYEDTGNPYHYFRVDKHVDYDRVIIGGEDHRQDIHVPPEKSFAALEKYACELFEVTEDHIVKRWRGPILEPVDGLAYIGPHHKDNVLYAFGFSGNGMTYASLGTLILRDTILGYKNAWSELYDIHRVPTLKSLMIKGRDYSEELFKGALRNIFSPKKMRYS